MDPILAWLPEPVRRSSKTSCPTTRSPPTRNARHHFVGSGLTKAQARKVSVYRSQYLCNLYQEGFTPILKGAQALRFNPYSRRFEPV